MDNVNMIILIIEFAVLAVSIFIGRNIVSKVSADDITNTVNKINLVIDYADKFVSLSPKFKLDEYELKFIEGKKRYYFWCIE